MNQNTKKTRGLGSQGCKIIIFMILVLTQIMLVSALNWDNSKSYNQETKTATITNAFGLGEKIAEAKLITPQINYVIPGKDRKVIIFEVENFGDNYKDALSNLEFLNLNNNKKNTKTYHWEYAVYGNVQVDDYKEVCELGVFYLNGTQETICNNIKSGTHTENRIISWEKLNSKDIPKGKLTIALVTDVNKGDYYDGIPTLFGVKINEWAVWTDGLSVGLISYYNFNDNLNDSLGNYNLNAGTSGSYVSGKLSNAREYSAGSGNTGDNSTGTSQMAFGTGNFTIGFWIKTTATTHPIMVRIGDTEVWGSGSDVGFGILGQTGKGNFISRVSNAQTSSDTFTNDEWQYVVYTRNSTGTGGLQIYQNGSYIRSGTAGDDMSDTDATLHIGQHLVQDSNGAIILDELGIWNRSLSSSEISDLYNSGTGITYPGATQSGTISVTLNSPTDLLKTSNTTIIFNSTITPANTNLTNATLFVWDSDNDIFNQTTNIVTGNSSNQTTFTINDFTVGIYKWNVLGCGINSTSDVICSYASNNRTIEINLFLENSQTFNSTTIETSIENFKINITYNSSLYSLATGILNYNGTNYVGTSSGSGNNILFSRNINVPTFSSNQNISFNWKFNFVGAAGTFQQNSTIYNQSVNVINASIYEHPYTVPYINFTVYNESSNTPINATFKITFNYGISSAFKNFSFQDLTGKNSSFSFSFNPPSNNYLTLGLIEYSSPGFIDRTYTLQQQTLTNQTTNIKLYLLDYADSTSFIVSVRDSSYTPISGAIVYIQRLNTGTNVWETTEVITTNYDGKAIGHFVPEDVTYRFLVYVNGVLSLTSSSTKIFCEVSPCTVTLTIPTGGGASLYGNVSNLDYNLVYTKSSNLFTYSYIDSDSSAQGGRLEVKKISLGNFTDSLICNTTSPSTSAVLTCDISSEINATYVATGYVTRGGLEILVERIIINKISDIISTIGLEGLLWTIFILIGIVMLGLYKPQIAILFSVVGLILVSMLGLAFIPTLSIISLICIAVIILWEMKR